MPTISKPAVEISDEVQLSLSGNTQTEGQVIVHVTYQNPGFGSFIRIWPTTYLVPQEGGEKSKLMHAEKICLAPQWMLLRSTGPYRFTLLFSPLPKDCMVFHLWEDIPEPNGFLIRNIARNEADVYEVELADNG